MLSLLRAMIGCWHDWEQWTAPAPLRVGGERVTGQTRRCRKCGKDQWRYA